MSSKNTMLFGAGLVMALGAVAADYATSEAPKPLAAAEENYNPCAVALPKKKGGRNYDDIAEGGTGQVPAAPAPKQSGKAPQNPCSIGQ